VPIGAKTMVPKGAKPKPKLNLTLKKREISLKLCSESQSFTIDFVWFLVIF
jgi:hypothetical protein